MLAKKQADVAKKLEQLQLANAAPCTAKPKAPSRPSSVAASSKAGDDDDSHDDDDEGESASEDAPKLGFGLVICPKTQKVSWI